MIEATEAKTMRWFILKDGERIGGAEIALHNRIEAWYRTPWSGLDHSYYSGSRRGFVALCKRHGWERQRA